MEKGRIVGDGKPSILKATNRFRAELLASTTPSPKSLSFFMFRKGLLLCWSYICLWCERPQDDANP
jgi:hypothetical protein